MLIFCPDDQMDNRDIYQILSAQVTKPSWLKQNYCTKLTQERLL